MNTDFNVFLNRAGNLLLLLVGMESICLLFCNSFGLGFSVRAGIWLAVLCVLLWVASGFRYGPLIALPLCALVLFLIYRDSGQTVASTFQALADQVVETYYSHFGSTASSPTEISASATAALLSMLFLLAAFLSFSLTSGSFRISLARLATFPVFIACFLVNGTPPVLPTLGILLFWIGLQLSGDSFRDSDGAGKSLLLGIVPCALVLAGLLLLYRPSTYHYDKRDIALSQQFDRIGNMLSDWFGGSAPSENGGPGSTGSADSEHGHAPSGWGRNQDILDLTVPFDYASLPETAMTFRSDVSGTVYLRGKSYGDYMGTAWSAAVENTHGNGMNYAGHSILNHSEHEKHQFQVFTSGTYDILYLPYYTMTGTLGDVSVPSGELTSYGGDFYRHSVDPADPGSSFSLPSSLIQEEQQYREYVHSYYTRLPESTRGILSQYCAENGLNAGQAGILSEVSSLIRSQGIYDLSVEAYPDSDYAVYFLTVSHRGYCIHYATAAVALFRAMDIPARICEGYMVNCIPNANVRITGENAHAWAEVYVDGFGWIPVEVTASQGASSVFPEAGSGESPGNLPEEFSPAEGSLEPDSGNDASTVPEDESSAGEQEQPEESEQPEDQNSDASPSTVHSLLRILLWLLGIPALFAAFLYARYSLLRFRHKSRFASAGTNQKAIMIYRDALRVSSFGAEVPESIRVPAEKAAFSLHELTDEEYASSYTAYKSMVTDTYSSLSRWNRFLFRFLYGLL